MKNKFKHIELFAGCGGMSLGLEAAGFELYFANELSPMAGETFSHNFIGDSLKELAKQELPAKNVLWIKSNYKVDNLKERLKENPFTFSSGNYEDLNKETDFNGKLLIGNIDHLLSFLAKNKSHCSKLRGLDIDLVSGGPPCQSFSLAGRREKDNHKNLLPLSFARFAGLVKPKVVLLENVKGITSAFKVDGKKFYAWLEVAKAFCIEGFVPICMMINSKYFGIPQNRPRFILLAIRKDVFDKIKEEEKNTETSTVLLNSLDFFEIVNKNKRSLDLISINSLKLHDIEKHPELFDGRLLPQIISKKGEFVSSKEAIEDLSLSPDKKLMGIPPSEYVIRINKEFRRGKDAENKKDQQQNKVSNAQEILNHNVRTHSYGVRARFRWFQIVSNLNGLTPIATQLLSGGYTNVEKMNLVIENVQGQEVLMNQDGKERLVKLDKQIFPQFIQSIQTKKHSQRALKATDPAPAQLTIPDDLCHYSPTQLRTLTVREMARFQSFPDWFEFKAKETTGGKQRSYEVPQYTQVGNAVPPLLAYQLGITIQGILKRLIDA